MAERPYRWLAYIGCRTSRERNARGKGLCVYGVDAAGGWEFVQRVEGLVNPSFLCLDATQCRLYCVHGDFSEVSSFAIEPGNGSLQQTGQQHTGGRNPVHLTLSTSQQWLLVANYASGNIVSLPVKTDGTLGSLASSIDLPGLRGPRAEQQGSHPHQLCFDPTGRWIFVPDKGLDKVFTLSQQEATGELKIAAETALPAGSGPRHMIFHPRASRAYVVGELNRTIMTCEFDPAGGQLVLKEVTSTVPVDVETGSAAGVAISGKGQSLHVSNRGHDSIASYPIDEDSGRLSSPTWSATGGRAPRFIGTIPDGQHLLVANEDSDSLVCAALDVSTAPLIFRPIVETGSPVCIVFKKVFP